jgi:hypothetical protein
MYNMWPPQVLLSCRRQRAAQVRADMQEYGSGPLSLSSNKILHQHRRQIFAKQSLKVVFEGPEQTTMIDMDTAAKLELLVNLRNPKSPLTLFGVLNHTKTASGGLEIVAFNFAVCCFFVPFFFFFFLSSGRSGSATASQRAAPAGS